MTPTQDAETNTRSGRTWLKAVVVLLAMAMVGGGWWGVAQLRASDGAERADDSPTSESRTESGGRSGTALRPGPFR